MNDKFLSAPIGPNRFLLPSSSLSHRFRPCCLSLSLLKPFQNSRKRKIWQRQNEEGRERGNGTKLSGWLRFLQTKLILAENSDNLIEKPDSPFPRICSLFCKPSGLNNARLRSQHRHSERTAKRTPPKEGLSTRTKMEHVRSPSEAHSLVPNGRREAAGQLPTLMPC